MAVMEQLTTQEKLFLKRLDLAGVIRACDCPYGPLTVTLNMGLARAHDAHRWRPRSHEHEPPYLRPGAGRRSPYVDRREQA